MKTDSQTPCMPASKCQSFQTSTLQCNWKKSSTWSQGVFCFFYQHLWKPFSCLHYRRGRRPRIFSSCPSVCPHNSRKRDFSRTPRWKFLKFACKHPLGLRCELIRIWQSGAKHHRDPSNTLLFAVSQEFRVQWWQNSTQCTGISTTASCCAVPMPSYCKLHIDWPWLS